MTGRTPAQVKQAIKHLQEQGFAVPEELTKIVSEKDYEARGVAQVWKCRTKSCAKVYESPTVISFISCICGRAMSRTWPRY